MPDTMQQVIARIRALLRRPSEAKLPYQDIQERANARLRGYVQDQQLNLKELRTEIVEVPIVEDDIDYLVSMPNVPDYEPVRLEYNAFDGVNASWYEVHLVPFSSWTQHFPGPRVTGSFYGSFALQEGMKLKLNIEPADVGNRLWRLSYRTPLLNAVQLGERPPIPTNHLPMLEYDSAVDCFPLVRDESESWLGWMRRTEPIYLTRSEQEHTRWQQYLESSVEPRIQDLPRFDANRRNPRRKIRAFWPVQ